MALKYAIEDLSSDLAFIGQISTGITKQVKSIKKKAENALASGYTDTTAVLDGSFFLSRELFDLDPGFINYANAYPDKAVQHMKDLYGFPFDTAAAGTYPTAIGPYHRNWVQAYQTNYQVVATALVNMDIAGDVYPVGGVTVVTNNRVLLTAQTDPTENGVYTVTVGVAPAITFVRYTTADIAYATIRDTGTSKVWWNYGTVSVPAYAIMTEYTAPTTGDTQANLLINRSHTIYGLVYHTEVTAIAALVTTLKSQMASFVTDVNTLREDSTLAAVIAHCTPVITDKTNIDASLESLQTRIFNVERIASYFNTWIPWAGGLWNEGDRRNQIMAGYLYKAHKPISEAVSYTQLEKTYNNNFTKALGDGSGGASPGGGSMTGNAGQSARDGRQIANNHNSIIEYWSQIGWMAAERANNYKSYIELLERDLEEKGLEEILEMHDKAVKDTYEKEKDLQEGFLQPYSPKPLTKPKRTRPDMTLPYTDAELRAIGLLPPL